MTPQERRRQKRPIGMTLYLGEQIIEELNEIVRLRAEESGGMETKTDTIRRVLHQEYVRLTGRKAKD